MPKVSVVVPIYNVEKYLKECLESLMQQTLKDIEIICVNDGSTDNSLQIIQALAAQDFRIKIIDKQNEGYGKTVNRGIKAATGEYIGILESDDFVKTEMFQKLVEIADNNNCDMVKCDFYNYFGETEQLMQVDQYPKEFLNKNLKAIEHPQIFKFQPAVWSAIYKKDFLDKNEIRFLETPGASYQDVSFAFKCYACAENLHFTNEPLLYYRQDNMTSSVNNKNKVYCIQDEFKEIERFVEEKNLTSLNDVIIYLKLSVYTWNLKRIAAEFHKEFIDFMSEEFSKTKPTEKIKELFSTKQFADYKLIMKNPQKYLKKFKSKLFFRKLKSFRKNLISIRKTNSKLQIRIFGKTLFSH